ncbi:uncharacterized protein LOC129739872 [Uranotaenia lowii]|uniref:uncharacterized protein LOC129739872 n=1 Tax=Uranotaenia lowii TaxID=190385 RepID=UPI00247ADAD2|nr:uncharacterized protein LOC129739872 [Uranotaenia lowii]
MPWTRPLSVPIPMVWHRFQGPDPNRQLVEYRIEDVTPDRYEEIIQLLRDHFMSRQIVADQSELRKQESYWRQCLEQKLSVVCYQQGLDRIVGINLLLVKQSNEPCFFESPTTGRPVKKTPYSEGCLVDRYDVFTNYRTNRYLTAAEVFVDRDYRGLEVAIEMLNSWVPICRRFGIRVISTDFKSQSAQETARKVGFRTDCEITYEECEKIGITLPDSNASNGCLKLMSMTVN